MQKRSPLNNRHKPPNPELLPPDSASILERFRSILLSQWEELLRLRLTLLKTFDPNDIHDLRVASRRFRATLNLCKPFVQKASKEELLKSIRKLTRVLGDLRNIDEAILFFQSHTQIDVPADSKLFRKLSALRPGELKRTERLLKGFDHRHLDRTVRKMVAGLNQERIPEADKFSMQSYFTEVSIRLYLPIHGLLPASTIPERRASRHALRIAIKKWRYYFETVAAMLDRDYSQTVELLKEYQSLLGKMNDITVFEVLLGRLALPRDKRDRAATILLDEETVLLKSLAKLVERNPLFCTFRNSLDFDQQQHVFR